MNQNGLPRALTERERWTLDDLVAFTAHDGGPLPWCMMDGVRVGCLTSLKALGLTMSVPAGRYGQLAHWAPTATGRRVSDDLRDARASRVRERAAPA